MAIAVPTFGSARERSRVRLSAGVVSQEIYRVSELAFAQAKGYTLDSGARASMLIATPRGGVSEVAIDLSVQPYECRVSASLLVPYKAALVYDSSGDVTSAVSWDIISGTTKATVVQEIGAVGPIIAQITKTSVSKGAAVAVKAVY